jgi:hypothetical protein
VFTKFGRDENLHWQNNFDLDEFYLSPKIETFDNIAKEIYEINLFAKTHPKSANNCHSKNRLK